jgi:hypothetical protein
MPVALASGTRSIKLQCKISRAGGYDLKLDGGVAALNLAIFTQ